MNVRLSRRGFLGGAASATTLLRREAFAQDALTSKMGAPALIRGAYVMTMTSEGDLPEADVLLRDGEIAAVGPGLEAPDAEVIDGRGKILLPGLVDTHNHLWLSQMRGLFGRSEATRYFPLVERLGAAFQPEDMAAGTLFGAAGALDAGVTTTFAFCDNIRRPADAEAALGALAEAGVRVRFLYTGHDALPGEEAADLDHLAALAGSWDRWSNEGLIELGFGWRAPPAGASEAAFERAERELAVARELGLPLSSHISGGEARARMRALIERGWLGPDMQLVHATDATAEQLRAVRDAGAAVSLTPITEQRVGFGLTFVREFEPVFDRLGLGIDGPLGGAPDMFAVMRTLHNVQTAASGEELAILPRRILEFATIVGARSVGMDGRVGSIRPGKRADLILVDTQALNMGPINEDPSALLVYSAKPRNVELVMVDGRVVKREGRLTALPADRVIAAAARSLERVRAAAGE